MFGRNAKRGNQRYPVGTLRGFVKFTHLVLTLLCTIAVTACNGPLARHDLDAIRDRGELVVITRNNAACYFESAHGPSGFEYELAKTFADYLGVVLRLRIIEDEVEMVTALLQGDADIIAAGKLFGESASRLLALGPGYLEVSEQIVGRRGGQSINAIQDLAQAGLGVSGSSAAIEYLQAIQRKMHPELNWQIFRERSNEELMQMVWNRDLPLAVITSNVLKMNHRFFPELVVQMEMGEPRQLQWAMNPRDRHLIRAVAEWFAHPATLDLLSGLATHYYSHLEEFDYVDLARFRRRIFDRLPQYRHFFEDAASQHDLDWRLVAALSYQESHWDPGAVSYTGVRGIMMLTYDTAQNLGISDRLAVKEVISAGTRYLARLHRLVGDDVAEPDRTLMALAAYNIGPGHLQDARMLARELGKPDDTWRNVRDVLPLLQQRAYYQTLPHGYSRGTEAVQYVDRIRTYHKILTMLTADEMVYTEES